MPLLNLIEYLFSLPIRFSAILVVVAFVLINRPIIAVIGMFSADSDLRRWREGVEGHFIRIATQGAGDRAA